MSEQFDWDDANTRHIALHEILPIEAEEVLSSFTKLLEIELVNGEERIKELGETERGRILVVVWSERAGKVRVVTAYNAPKALKLDWNRIRIWRLQ